MGNRALDINGFSNRSGVTDNHITVRGSNWLWAVTAVMLLSTLAFLGWSFTRRRSQRIFHYLAAAITFVSGIAYFTMASNLGWAAVRVHHVRSNPKVAGLMRQIFYARYIDWFITAPLILLLLLLTANVPRSTIVFSILMAEVAVVMALVGALVSSSYKWGFFAFGVFALLWVLYTLMVDGMAFARAHGADIKKTYVTAAGLTVLVWSMYPVCWGLSEGGNVIAPDSEAIFYGILDLLTKPVLCALLLLGHRNIDLGRLGLSTREPGQPHGLHEKNAGTTVVPPHHGVATTAV